MYNCVVASIVLNLQTVGPVETHVRVFEHQTLELAYRLHEKGMFGFVSRRAASIRLQHPNGMVQHFNLYTKAINPGTGRARYQRSFRSMDDLARAACLAIASRAKLDGTFSGTVSVSFKTGMGYRLIQTPVGVRFYPYSA